MSPVLPVLAPMALMVSPPRPMISPPVTSRGQKQVKKRQATKGSEKKKRTARKYSFSGKLF